MEIKDQIKAIIESQVILALKEQPDALEALVKAALSPPVDANTGRSDGYGTKIPYLDWLVADAIRAATRAAVIKIVQERAADIEAAIRKQLTDEKIINAFATAMVNQAAQEWRIEVKFHPEKPDR